MIIITIALIVIILIVNRLTFRIKLDYVGLNNENITDFTNFKFVIYYYNLKAKQRRMIVL